MSKWLLALSKYLEGEHIHGNQYDTTLQIDWRLKTLISSFGLSNTKKDYYITFDNMLIT